MKTTPFPQPVHLPGLRARWRLSDLEVYETGETDRTTENERYLTANQVGKRYGVSRVSIWNAARKARDQEVQA